MKHVPKSRVTIYQDNPILQFNCSCQIINISQLFVLLPLVKKKLLYKEDDGLVLHPDLLMSGDR